MKTRENSIQDRSRALHRATTALASLSLSLLASSCGGRVFNSYVPTAPKSAFASQGDWSNLETDDKNGDFVCPDHPDVIPDYDSVRDGSGHFTVCSNPKDATSVLIHGEISHGSSICVFPALVVDDSNVSALPNWKCVPATEGGAMVSFPGFKFNAAFIVTNHERDQMRACLVQGNYYLCPSYSFGKFRD